MKLLFTIVVAGVLLSACSASQCEATCQGCCSPAGVCLGGTATDQCGNAGASCSACATGKTCTAGVCRSSSMGGGTGGSGGGSTGGGGGSTGGGGGVSDGGVSDGGVSDGGVSDGGVSDGGVSDGGVSDGGASDGGVSDGGVDGGIDAGPRSPAPRLFVTSAKFSGDLVTAAGVSDPIVASDRLCTDAAADAGLTGTWRGFVGVGLVSAMERHNPGAPYRLVGSGIQVFRTASALAQPPEVALNRNEFGAVVPNSAVWTGVDRGGTNDGVDCSSWSAAVVTDQGSVGFTFDAGGWTGALNLDCDQQNRLYCFEY